MPSRQTARHNRQTRSGADARFAGARAAASLWRGFQPSQLVRNVVAVASGAAAAQIITVAFAPVLTRIFSPEVFGLQGIFLSLVSILSPVIALRYPMAIITAETGEEAGHLATLALMVAAAMAVVMWVLLLAGGDGALHALGAADLGALIYLLPLALFCVALQDIKDLQATRLGAFQHVGIASLFQAVAANLGRMIGGLFAAVAGVLVLVTTFAPAVKAALLMLMAADLRRSVRLPDRAGLGALRKYRAFPLYQMPTDVIGAISQAAPVILLAALFSPAAAGLYVLARMVINLPLNVVGLALGSVLYAQFADLSRDKERLLPLVLKATLFQLTLPGAGLAIVAVFFPALFAFAFGEAWREAGSFAQWMVLWIICMLVNVPSVRVLPVISAQRWHLFFNSFIAVAGICGLLAGQHIWGTPLGAVAGYSVATALAYSAQIVTYLALVRRFDERCAR